MRRYVSVAAIILIAYALFFSGGCSLLPLEDIHHDHHAEDEHEGEQEHKPPSPPDIEEDPEMAMLPPEAQEAVKNATVDEAIEMLMAPTVSRPGRPDAVTVAGYVYRHGGEQDRRRLEEVAADLAQNSDDPRIRATAITLLSGFDNSYLDLRLRTAKSDPEPEVRKAAIGTLWNEGVLAAGVLRELTKDPNAELRQLAQDILIHMMAGLGDEGIKALVRDLGVYRNDASALASTQLVLRGLKALPYLIDAAVNDHNKHRRAAATTCIAMICAGNNPSLDEFAERAQATRHAEQKRREAKLEGLKPLLYVLENDPYAPAREAAAQGLGYLGAEEAAAGLAKALYDPDDHVRRRAAAALETIPAEAVVQQLADVAANDKVPQVRAYAVKALGSIGSTPVVISGLAKATEDSDPEVRQHAADELGRMRAKEAVDALLRMFDDPDDDVRWAAVRAVGELRSKKAVPYLVKALQDEVPQVTNAAERGLQKLGIAKRKGIGFESEGEDTG